MNHTHLQPGYWNENLLDGQLPRQRPHRYLAFDIDQGGLNNIRLVLEYAAVLAAVTGRTLVLPPPCSWYLINHGPVPGGEPGGTTAMEDVFDIAPLARALPVLTTAGFIMEAGEHLAIPAQFRPQDYFLTGSDPFQAVWRKWLQTNAEVPGWNPYDTLICLPDVATMESSGALDPSYVDGRRLVEVTPRLQAAPVLYLPSNEVFRSLGPVATMLADTDGTLPMLGRRLIKHHVRYRPEIFRIAQSVVDKLGAGGFDAIHVRRNDFQYTETRLAAADIARNTRPLFDASSPLYIATDEDDQAFFQALGAAFEGKPILRWCDVADLAGEPVSELWLGPVEQLICVAANRFAGTDLSTFSTYIHRLRGYISPESHVNHYHGVDHGQATDAERDFTYGGREYLRENPLFWLAC